MGKDVRITKLTETLRESLAVLETLVKEKDERLEAMTNSEWGGVQGQHLQGQANALECARLNLQFAVEFVLNAETFNA